MTDLFDPLTLRGVTLKNRIGVSPMCQYCCAEDGKPTEWHHAHLVSRAIGGAALTFTEAAAVSPEGRISPNDLGIWSDAQLAGHKRLAAGIAAAGSVPGIQLAHAGRKASRKAPWADGPAEPGWACLAPSAAGFGHYAVPRAMSEADIAQVIAEMVAAARRSVVAGYKVIELHAAHGYLMHQFLSPLSNRRNDAWGGDFDGRVRLVEEAVKAVRAAIPDELVLAIRISHSDWVEGGWTTAESVQLAARLQALGVDLVDVSSGGLDHRQQIPLGPLYQVPGAVAVKEGAPGLAVATVGLITEPAEAQAVVAEGKADLVLLGRVLLRDPYWPLHAAAALGRTEALPVPPQYERGWMTLGRMPRDMAIATPQEAL